MASDDEMVFALRGLKQITFCKYAVGTSAPSALSDLPQQSRVMTFSDDGSLFSFCDGTRVQILSGSNFKPLVTIPRGRTAGLQFSPHNTILATWEPFLGNQPSTDKPQENLELWDAHTGELVKSFVQKKQFDWCPQWTKDEKVCSRNINNEIVFYEDNKFDSVKYKLHMAKVANYVLAERDTQPYYVAVHMPGSKGQPSSVRIFQYPNFGGLPSSLASKSFYKAESAQLVWNSKGTSLLIHTSTEASSSSYYGEQGLHYVDTKGESCLVPRAKEGPVYSAVWSPNSMEFCVVYGCMPAKATLYNLKCEPVFDFGTGPRNLAYYNPHGSVLCLAGFGNLRGNMELWDVGSGATRRLISNPQAIDSTQFDWCPDGQHFMTATTTPRLRIGNGYKIWHISGTCLYVSPTWPDELYEAAWQPKPAGFYPAPSIPTIAAAVKTAVTAQQQQAKPKAYVPPALRDQPQPVNKPRYREAYEPDSTTKQLLAEHKEPSKSALKNKKKREAKARRKQEEQTSSAAAGEGSDTALNQQLKDASLDD